MVEADTKVIEKDDRELREGEVIVGVATTPEEKIERLEVVTDRYKLQGYLQGVPFAWVDLDAKEVVEDNGYSLLEQNLEPAVLEKFLKEGLLISFRDSEQLYIDKYHWQSIQFVARNEQGYVGSVRLIMDTPDDQHCKFGLPTLCDKAIEIDEEWREAANKVTAELSQFAKLKEAPASVTVGLLRAVAQYSKKNNIEEWVATTDNMVVKLLNGIFFNFGLPKIGKSVQYLGSESTPILINIEQSLKNAEEKASSKEMARFIRGEEVKGFEWYTGI